jgi:hypothetical protein
MKHNLVSALSIAAAIALPCGLTVAQGLQPQPGQTRAEQMGIPSSGHYTSFWQLDTNKDGHITREEARNSPALTRRFNEIDTNGDGILSPEELKGWSFRDSAGVAYIKPGTAPAATSSSSGSARN